MRSIAFFNNKGGVGKTTLLCNVASFVASNHKAKVLVVDADPQCNATQLMLDEDEVLRLYEDTNAFTIHSVIHPLSIGKGYSKNLSPLKVDDYALDLIPGDPRLALTEDLLSKDWQDAIGGDIRGLRTTYLFSEFLTRCAAYDYVFFDMGPSLGSINRAVLLACDFFLSPMSIDIFSLRAIENIATSLQAWKKKLSNGLSQADASELADIPNAKAFDIMFCGYVAQNYIQKSVKKDNNEDAMKEKREVLAYENIMKRIPKTISSNIVTKLQPRAKDINYRIGSIPNLYSLIPMAQTAHKPIFGLKAKDGVRGAHFNKVKDAEAIFSNVTKQLILNVKRLEK